MPPGNTAMPPPALNCNAPPPPAPAAPVFQPGGCMVTEKYGLIPAPPPPEPPARNWVIEGTPFTSGRSCSVAAPGTDAGPVVQKGLVTTTVPAVPGKRGLSEPPAPPAAICWQ